MVKKLINIILAPIRLFYIKTVKGVIAPNNILILGKPFINSKRGHIILGERVKILSDQANFEIGMPFPCVLTTKNSGKIIIGNDVILNGVSIRAHDHIFIGNNTWITAGCYIMDNNGHHIEAHKRLYKDSTPPSKPIKIGSNVWIGINSIILPGAKIGDNCVIGAGSVVNSKIPSNCLAAGIPAKPIKKISS